MGRRTMERVLTSTTERQVDMRTGEIASESTATVTRLPAEPPYVKLYLDDLTRVLDLAAGPKDLLMVLVRKIDYEGMITLSPSSRRRMAGTLGIADQTFRNRLRDLVKAGVLLRRGHNEYEANPMYFARGDWRDIYERRKALTMSITYSERGKSISTQSEAIQEDLDLGIAEG